VRARTTTGALKGRPSKPRRSSPQAPPWAMPQLETTPPIENVRCRSRKRCRTKMVARARLGSRSPRLPRLGPCFPCRRSGVRRPSDFQGGGFAPKRRRGRRRREGVRPYKARKPPFRRPSRVHMGSHRPNGGTAGTGNIFASKPGFRPRLTTGVSARCGKPPSRYESRAKAEYGRSAPRFRLGHSGQGRRAASQPRAPGWLDGASASRSSPRSGFGFPPYSG
jgi:hypothetical protein